MIEEPNSELVDSKSLPNMIFCTNVASEWFAINNLHSTSSLFCISPFSSIYPHGNPRISLDPDHPRPEFPVVWVPRPGIWIDVSITDVISLFDIPQYGLLKKTYCMFCSLILTTKAFHPEFYQTLWLVSIHYNDTTKQLLNVSLHVHCKYIQTCAVWPDSVSTRSSLFQMYIWKVPL